MWNGCVDANQDYDVPSAIAAARAFEPYGIGWFEEPVHWYDSVFGLSQVLRAIDIPTANGESEQRGCRDLIEHAGMAPHHDAQIHGHLVAAVPNGHTLEVFPNPLRDRLWEELFTGRPTVTNGAGPVIGRGRIRVRT